MGLAVPARGRKRGEMAKAGLHPNARAADAAFEPNTLAQSSLPGTGA